MDVYFDFVLQVLIPNGTYKGQKLIKLVNTNTAANINKTIPQIPVTVLVKYKTTKTNATIKRKILSNEPMFFFI
jgi:hypothetical protein